MDAVLAIDPGLEQSGWVTVSGAGDVWSGGVSDNGDVLALIDDFALENPTGEMAIEMVQSFGMPVGADVFETVYWIGRFSQMWANSASGRQSIRVPRSDVKMHHCQTQRAKDANIRQAIIDRYPPTGGGKIPQIGVKRNPGPLYGVRSHIWQALAVALVVIDRRQAK